MTLSNAIPCIDAAESIRQAVEGVFAVLVPAKEMIIFDRCSPNRRRTTAPFGEAIGTQRGPTKS